MLDRLLPYNDLPFVLPPGFDFKSTPILVKSLSAMQSIAELNSVLNVDQNSIVHTLNMMSPLYVPEAVASSEVEEIITTNESVYENQALDEDEIPQADKEVLRYTEALLKSFHKQVNQGFMKTNDLIEMQAVLEPSKSGLRRLPETKLSNPKTGYVYYTPPDQLATIRRLLKNFEDIYNQESPKHEILSRAAILHYQFEAIHPFPDGNGRAGRILIPLYLARQRLLVVPLLFTSKYILENRDQYYQKLRAVTFKAQWEAWVLYILDALDTQARYTLKSLKLINRFHRELQERLAVSIGQGNAAVIARFMYRRPYFTQAQFEEGVSVSAGTARKYLLTLESKGILIRKKQRGRNRYLYACPDYVQLMKKI